MSIRTTGPRHNWFAWHPVETDFHGWKWLRTVTRYRVWIDIPEWPTFWAYDIKDKR